MAGAEPVHCNRWGNLTNLNAEHLHQFNCRKDKRYRHSVQFYDEDRKLVNDVSAAIESALDRGDSVVIIATEGYRSSFRRELRRRDLDLTSMRVKRRYFEFDADQTLSQFMAGNEADLAMFSQIMGHVLVNEKTTAVSNQVFAFGEMVALLSAKGKHDSAIRLERMWNDLAHTHSFSLHCAYPLNCFELGDHDYLRDICAEHSALSIHQLQPRSELARPTSADHS